jgi:HTH-type transcriptional regulator/antitoxin HigA
MEQNNLEKFRTPGQLIDALLISKGWNQRVLAIVLNMDETGINRLVADKRPVTAELAVVLEEILGVPADKLLTLQKEYDLAKARITVMPDKGRNTRAQLFGGLPVAEMIKRGWLQADNVRDVIAVESSLSKFFGVASPDEIEILPHAAKKTDVMGEVTPAQLAWLYRVRQIANTMLTARYSPIAVKSSIKKLNALLAAPEEARKVPRILAESGIRFVIVESLPSAKIDGVCFWLNESQPVIGMSLRHDRIDNFWFVLRHELEHVIQLHGLSDGRATIMLDTELEEKIAASVTNISEEELVANNAAADFCVPQESMESFIARKSPLFTEKAVIGFSRTLNLHPGLIVGQLQHRTGRYDLFRKYLVKMRTIIAPNAIVDGWGDIAPVEF